MFRRPTRTLLPGIGVASAVLAGVIVAFSLAAGLVGFTWPFAGTPSQQHASLRLPEPREPVVLPRARTARDATPAPARRSSGAPSAVAPARTSAPVLVADPAPAPAPPPPPPAVAAEPALPAPPPPPAASRPPAPLAPVGESVNATTDRLAGTVRTLTGKLGEAVEPLSGRLGGVVAGLGEALGGIVQGTGNALGQALRGRLGK